MAMHKATNPVSPILILECFRSMNHVKVLLVLEVNFCALLTYHPPDHQSKRKPQLSEMSAIVVKMEEIVRHVQPLAERFQWIVLLALGFVFVKLFQWIASSRPHSKIPVVKIERRGFLDYLIPAHFQWMRNAAGLITSGLEDFPKGCFQVPTSSGYKVVVPSRYAEELKSHPNLNFNESFAEEFFVDYPGFEPHRQGLRNGNFMPEVVGVKLTRSLGLVTSDLVEEASFSVHKAFGDEEEWKSIVFKQNLLDVVARLSSRVFLGKERCRNKDWLRITKEHTVDSFAGAQLLHPHVSKPAPSSDILVHPDLHQTPSTGPGRETFDQSGS
jgi:hypothetical protein